MQRRFFRGENRRLFIIEKLINLMPMIILGFLGISLGAWAVIAAFITTAATVYVATEQKKEAKKTRELQEEQLTSAERQAGEYYELTEKQMELQSQAASIDTLANLITRTKESAAPQVFTLPPAKKYGPIERINQAIDDLLRG